MQSFAIIPAAGRSRRMGQPKLTLPWRNGTIIEHVLGVWQKSRVTRIVVVVHPDDKELADRCHAKGADVVVAPTPPPQMRDSVELGLAHVSRTYAPSSDDVWLLAPADMPKFSAAVIDGLLDRFPANDASILIPSYARRCGHPVLFAWPTAEEVRSLPPEQGINALVEKTSFKLIECDEAGILTDIDTPEDYLAEQARDETP